MMPYQFAVSPDFSPYHLSGWYFFNTWLQKQTGEAFHLETYDNYQSQREAIRRNEVDLIYANPFDAAMLVHQHGFLPLVRANDVSDEAIIAVSVDSAVDNVTGLMPGVTVAVTEDPDVRMMGMIMLEPANLNAGNIKFTVCGSYVLVAKHLLQGNADAGFFLAEAYDDLSNITKNKLKVLVRSQISVIHHSLMIGSRLADKRNDIQNLLVTMNQDEKGRNVLKSLGFNAWIKVEDEEMEFMIDLMDALAI